MPRNLILCHQFCEVALLVTVAFARVAYYKSYTTEADGRMCRSWAGKMYFWSLILMYFAGLASWRWWVVARGFRVKTNVLEVFRLLPKILLSLKRSLSRAKEREREREANWYKES